MSPVAALQIPHRKTALRKGLGAPRLSLLPHVGSWKPRFQHQTSCGLLAFLFVEEEAMVSCACKANAAVIQCAEGS